MPSHFVKNKAIYNISLEPKKLNKSSYQEPSLLKVWIEFHGSDTVEMPS